MTDTPTLSMSTRVVVLGAGYAGTGAVKAIERAAPAEVELTWIADVDYHLVLHEVHRVIRDPAVAAEVAIPIDEVSTGGTSFIEATVTGIDTEEQAVALEDDRTVGYDYLLVAIGTGTAFYGIDGLDEHAFELKSLADAEAIHTAMVEAATAATPRDPAEVVIGGAGLSGIQTAGEIAAYRDAHAAPLSITLIEGLDEVFPGSDPSFQGALRRRLEAREVNVMTGEFISSVDAETVHVGEEAAAQAVPYDVLVWTGGITGRPPAETAAVEKDDRSHRFTVDATFQTSDPHVFALGDAAIIEQPEGSTAPPTAQAAWQAAEVAGENLVRAVRGEQLRAWQFDDHGTVVSVGDDAVAHAIDMPVIGELPAGTFGGIFARNLKKVIAARWIADVASYGRAMRAWSSL
jgi:NADH dehydrogenase, FAD-containing subunit